jgi:hypothetical protein
MVGATSNIQSDRFDIALTSRERHARIDDDEWHADAFLVHEPFVGQSSIAKSKSIVCAEDDDRVLGEPESLQFGNDSATSRSTPLSSDNSHADSPATFPACRSDSPSARALRIFAQTPAAVEKRHRSQGAAMGSSRRGMT